MLRVLVVDDDPSVRFTVRVALEGHPPSGEPMAVSEAGDGQEALAVLADQPFDIVLLDVSMPVLDGFGVLHALRQDDPDIAVVMLTARGREVDIVKAYRAGADGYVTKPFDVDRLAHLTREVGESDPLFRAQRRARELERAELLLQLELGFGAAPAGPSGSSS